MYVCKVKNDRVHKLLKIQEIFSTIVKLYLLTKEIDCNTCTMSKFITLD